MKTHPPTRQSGFTLIELLVVISIIAVLAGLAVPTANIVMKKAKEAQARAAVTGLAIAVKGYQTEYNRLPNPSGGGGGAAAETPIDTDSGSGIVAVLIGKDSTYNPREVVFYEPPIAKSEANGLIASSGDGGSGGTYEVVDPWSRPSERQYYHMAFDYDGDRKIINPVKADGSKFNPSYVDAEPTDLTTEVVVYSDNDPRTPSASRKPITSW